MISFGAIPRALASAGNLGVRREAGLLCGGQAGLPGAVRRRGANFRCVNLVRTLARKRRCAAHSKKRRLVRCAAVSHVVRTISVG